ncbi:MAG: hypothetical protein IPH49_10930 [Ignavibacteria bacterium]|nr:hypothetical protein [Ignavibacteria bacterium]
MVRLLNISKRLEQDDRWKIVDGKPVYRSKELRDYVMQEVEGLQADVRAYEVRNQK